MAIPSAACADDIPADVCCDTLWLIGDRIRTVAFEGLCGCEDCGAREFRSYQSIGTRIEDVLGESLIIVMTGATASNLSPSGKILPAVVTRATYRLELRENGWPQSEVNERQHIQVPDGAMLNAVSKHALGHGEKVWRNLVNAAARRQGDQMLFHPSVNPHIINGVQVGQLAPIGPEAYQVAFSINIVVDVMLL